ncbi:hypothetical protein IEQ11_16505 [Lysobacter capsici]|jgi:small-conductance mechanosensitive channel|uniref:hypothetical protein n=1 Tax=Lysobacter capsici TaxID=435897 RepID=UPI0007164994|nr:hypothetical protein [Lysobacter capsici]ALN86826.1 hypothetical protein LC55x_3569 [Lysobacter capsici]ATE72726.1 hypothetical protein CNO08_16045 [Lysobacter capsici]QWF15461.1 hypothetical protein KME82_16935 [Lysobacter capsici]UOF13340.1 hypothetical protein IEQ11_16505 [Lysobacter capsici]
MSTTTHALMLPAIMLISAVPTLVAAVLVARGNLHLVNGLDASRLRDPAATAARLSRLLALIAIAILLAAPGYYWAAGNDSRTTGVTVALLIAVNGLVVALMLAVAKARRDYRDRDARRNDTANGSRDERTGRR